MSPEKFTKKHFGVGSSHPAAQYRTLTIAAIGAFAPLALLVVAAVVIAVEFPDLLIDLQVVGTGVRAALLALSFGVSLVATVALSAGVSRRLCREGDREAPPDHVTLVWVGIGVILGIVVPMFGPEQAWLPDTIRFLCRVTAVLPIMLLLVFIAGGEEQATREKGKVAYNRPTLSAFAAMIGFLVLQSILVSVLEYMGRSVTWATFGGVLPFMDALPRRLGLSAVLVPLLALVMAVRRTWPILRPEKAQSTGKAGWFKRFLRFICSFLGFAPRGGQTESEESEDEIPDNDEPEWLRPLLDRAGLEASTYFEEFARSTSAFESDKPELAVFFGGLRPTRDQILGLERFLRLNAESLRGIEGGDATMPSSDLLLTGGVGSGRSRTLHACVMASVIARGQGVLILVPDGVQRRYTVDRVARGVEALGMSTFLAVGMLGNSNINAWIHQRGRAIEAQEQGDSDPAPELTEPIPEILVGTLQDLERHVFGRQCTKGEAEAVIELLARHDTIFVEDLEQFEGPQRAHLPFVLDKLRLFHSSRFRRPQVVIVTPPLEPAARSVVGARLFGVRSFDTTRNCVTLRPRSVDPCWVAEVELDSVAEVDAARVSLASAAVAEGLKTLLYIRDIDEDAAREHEQSLSSGQGDLRVIGDLDSLDLFDDSDPDLAVYTSSLRADDLLQLRTGVAGRPVLVRLRLRASSAMAATDGERSESVETVPLFPSREAEAIGALHLATALPLLPVGLPVPAAVWMDVGFDPRQAESENLLERPLGEWRMDEVAARPEIDRLVVLGSNPDSGPSIDVSIVLTPETRSFKRSRSTGMYYIRSGSRSEGERLALGTWRERHEDGAVIAAVELAHIEDLRLELNGRYLVPRTWEEREDGSLALIAMPAQGDGEDATHPLLELTLEFSDEREVRVSFHSPDRGLAVVASKAANCRLVTEMVGLATEFGAEQQLRSFSFEQDVWAGAVLMSPRRLHPDDVESVLGRLFSGRRQTRSDVDPAFLPALTAALNHAFDVHFDGSLWFARVAAFSLEHLGDSRPAEAVCFILQPDAVHHTVTESLDTCFRSGSLSETFLRTASDMLERCLVLDAADARSLLIGATTPCVGIDGDLRLEESVAVLRRTIEHSGRHERIAPRWQVDRATAEHVDPSTDRAGRKWDVSAARDCASLSDQFVEALEAALGAHPKLRWHVSLIADGLVSSEAALREACGSEWSLGFGSDRVTFTPEGALGIPGLQQLLANVLPGRMTEDVRASVTDVELRLWGEPSGRTRRVTGPLPLDLRLEFGLLSDGRVTLARVSESAPVRVKSTVGASIDLVRPTNPVSCEVDWTPLARLEEPIVGGGEHSIRFHFEGRVYQVEFGMPSSDARSAYMLALEELAGRASGPSWDSHLRNDPFPGFVPKLSTRLQELYGREVDADYAAFALAFVQALKYIPDSTGPTDWPRFPSEYFTLGGGDCEDSSLALVALLNDVGLDAAYLEFDGHLAVGVRGPFTGRFYEHAGYAWFLAETAVDAGARALGTAPEPDVPLQRVAPSTLGLAGPGSGACILGAWIDIDDEGVATARVTLFTDRPGLRPVLVAQRRTLGSSGRDRPRAVAEWKFKESGPEPALVRCEIELDLSGDESIGRTAIDLVVWDSRRTGHVLAHWEQAGTLISSVLADA